MFSLLMTIVLICVLGAFAYYRLRPLLWMPITAVLLLLYTSLQWVNLLFGAVCWFVFVTVCVVLLLKPFRLHFIIKPVRAWFRTKQPAISQDEQTVLNAGGTWWETEIFSGSPNWRVVLDKNIDALSVQEQAFLDNQVETLCSMLNEWDINNKYKDLPREAWDYIKSERFWALCMDKQYGGLGFSHAAHSAIVTKVASRSISAAYTVMVPNSLGPAELIDYCGTPQQKEQYLPRLANGREIGCFGLTNVHAGSDAASIPDKGIVCTQLYEGKQTLGIHLNFAKRYITLAPVATLIGLAFHLFDPDGLLGDKEDVGITVALLPSNHPGVEIGKRHSPMTLGFMNGPFSGKDVFIPLGWVIGGADNCGQGWKILMGCLSVGRGISMPALASAVGQQCVRLSGAYAKIRRQFKRSVGEFEGIKESLAHVGGFAYLIEANRYGLAQAVSEGARPSVAAAIAKYHLTELSRTLLQYSMDIHSGHALQAGPKNLLAEVYNGLPISTVGEGANIMTRNLIIFGQGVMRAHPYIRREIMAGINETDEGKSLRDFDSSLLEHLGFAVSSWARGFCYGLTQARWIKTPKSRLAPEIRIINRLSNALVSISDIALMILGKELKFRESLSARLGDVLSYLYMATAVVKYFHDNGQASEEQVFARWVLAYCFNEISAALERFFANFPNRFCAKLIKAIFFPWGMKFAYPSDRLSYAISDAMQNDSVMRDRLTQYCYVGMQSDDAIGRVERAWTQVNQTQPIMDKVNTAIKVKTIQRGLTREESIRSALAAQVLTAMEAEQLLSAEKARDAAMHVDEFAFQELVRFNAEVYEHLNAD